MKESNIRVLHSKSYSGKDVIHGQTRREKEMSFHCTIDPQQDTIIQEDIEDNRVVGLRIKNLVNPPPDVNLEPYMSVSKLELSCPMDIPWVFFISSSLPGLEIIRFGKSSFVNNNTFQNNKISLSKSLLPKSPQVKELVVCYNYAEKLRSEHSTRLIDIVDSILELAAYFLTGLMKANLVLPLGVNIDGFLGHFPAIRSNGDKREVFKHGYISFVSQGKHTPIVHPRSPTPQKKKEVSDPRLKDPRLKDPGLKDPRLKDPRIKDPKPPPVKKAKPEYYAGASEREEEPCTSTTYSPLSDRSSESDRPSERRRRSSNNPSRSPSLLMDYNQMYTRR